MAHPLLDDPFVSTVIEDAVAPFQQRLLPEDLNWLRDQLALMMKLDPHTTSLLQGAHPRHPAASTDVDMSGERGVLGVEGLADAIEQRAAEGTNNE